MKFPRLRPSTPPPQWASRILVVAMTAWSPRGPHPQQQQQDSSLVLLPILPKIIAPRRHHRGKKGEKEKEKLLPRWKQMAEEVKSFFFGEDEEEQLRPCHPLITSLQQVQKLSLSEVQKEQIREF